MVQTASWVRAIRVIALGCWLVVVVSGVWLLFFNVPTAAAAYANAAELDQTVTLSRYMRRTHSLAAPLALLGSLAATVTQLTPATMADLRRPATLAMLGTAAALSGLRLPWDSLALWAAVPGKGPGLLPVFSGDFRQVLPAPDALLFDNEVYVLFLAHVVVLPILVAMVLALEARQLWGSRGQTDVGRAPSTPEAP